MRVSKAPEERREQLLDVALGLCAEVGFEALSIEQLTREASVAKGTFYYYFASKQDLLLALVGRYVDALFVELEATASRLTGSGLERFRALMLGATTWKTGHVTDAYAFVPLLYKRENLPLRYQLFDEWAGRMREVFLPLVERGTADGSLAVDDPEATTDLVLSIWIEAGGRMFDRALATTTEEAWVDTLLRGIASLTSAVERILGAAPGSFQVPVDGAFLGASRAPFLAALDGPSDQRA
ncbi:TetR/AcrR family transcriptional regulator [Raineyella sp. LH-20]|uniref:TetR/AcrR family transcriptional regulator n=1 Tax=Raineyella sp. LH-20 TaxID=3081204 RepID=UPI002955A4E3|nr:TetR/AcrR family transcriptional regulator [Raineyella sp. LH-20]WOP18520.1 TetR/AcrR family transcriptional regulator [Raineyella sp. LH-20]